VTQRDVYIEQMKQQLDEVRRAGQDSWQQGVAEMDRLRTALTRSVQYFKAQMRADPA
jgi:hypothetical protein